MRFTIGQLFNWQIYALILIILLGSVLLPHWMLFPASSAFANGIAALGIVILMRTGNVTFGQALPLCIGAYAAALAPNIVGINDIFINALIAGIAAAIINLILGLFMKRYSGIFFAMLTLAFSMVLYGMLANISTLGGTDGFSTPRPSFLGYMADTENFASILFVSVGAITCIVLIITNFLSKTCLGWAIRATGTNDIRVSYLGVDPKTIIWITIIYSGFLAGVGGAMVTAISSHVTPEFSYWTQSGELVLIAILGNSVYGFVTLIAAGIIETVRVVSIMLFPYTWQASLGIILLVIVLLFPNGFDSLINRKKKEVVIADNLGGEL